MGPFGLLCCGWEIADFPLQNPSIASSDFYPFGTLKKHVAGNGFARDADVKQAVTSWLKTLDTCLFFYFWIQALALRCDMCLNINGDYVEVWCVPSAAGGPCVHWKERERERSCQQLKQRRLICSSGHLLALRAPLSGVSCFSVGCVERN